MDMLIALHSRRSVSVIGTLALLLFVVAAISTTIPTAAQNHSATPCIKLAPTFSLITDTPAPSPTASLGTADPCGTPAPIVTTSVTVTPTPGGETQADSDLVPPAATAEGLSMAFAACGSNSTIETTYAIIGTDEEQCFIDAVNYSNGLPSGAPTYQIYLTGDLTFNNTSLALPTFVRGLEIYGNNSLFTVPANKTLFFGENSTGGPYVLSHMIITNGGDPLNRNYGGAVYNHYHVKIYDTVFNNNAALSGGGALFTSDFHNKQASTYLERVRFTNNRAGGGSAIQVDRGSKLTGECVSFENNSGYGGALSGYGQSILIGTYGGTVSLHESGFRTKYVEVANQGIYPQLFNLTSNSFTVSDSYFKPSIGAGPSGGAAVVIDPGYLLETSTNVAIYNPQATDPTLGSACTFRPPAQLPPQQLPPVACTAMLNTPINIRREPSANAPVLLAIVTGSPVNTEFLGVYKAGSSNPDQWWYLVRFNGNRLGWISGQVLPNPCPNIPITLVDQSGNSIAATPTPSPTATFTITPGPSPTPSGDVIAQLGNYGIFPTTINNGNAWTTQELQEMLLGVTAIAEAFRSISTQSTSVTKEQIFKAVMGNTQTNIEIRRSGVSGGYCQRDGLVITCFGDTLLAPDGDPLPFTQYVLAHELGHIFDNRADSGGERLIAYMESGLVIADCEDNRVLGEVSSENPPIIFWTRGERGWGTGPARIGESGVFRQVTDFQQNALLIQFQADPSTVDHQFLVEADPPLQPPSQDLQQDSSDAKLVRVEEGAADMFLNWVYRRNIEGTSPTYEQVCSQPITSAPIISFLNLSWADGIQTPIPEATPRSGDSRFAWMNDTMLDIFNTHGW